MIIRTFVAFSIFLIHTQLNGQIWLEHSNNPELQLVNCSFVDSMHFRGYNEYQFLKSDDGGLNWTITNLPAIPSAVFFVDSLNGWLCCDSARILHTSDGGISWTLQQLNFNPTSNPINISNLQFINKDVGFGLYGNQFISTVNGGANWSSISAGFYGINCNNSSMKFTDAFHGWATCNDRTVIHKTTDGGLSWNSYFLPSNFKAKSSLDFVDTLHGWMNTDSLGVNKILRTIDGGITWQNPASGIYAQKIKFRDSLFGFCIDSYSIISSINYSIDGGLNWTPINHGLNVKFKNVEIVNENYYFFGEGNTFLCTDLQNFSRITTFNNYRSSDGFGQKNKGLKMKTREKGILIKQERHIGGPCDRYEGGFYITNDSGRTWLGYSENPVCDVEFVSDSLIFFTDRGDNNWRILKSNDFLFSWQVVGNSDGQAIHFFDALHGVHTNAYTVDGGITWLPNTINGGVQYKKFNDIDFVDQNNGWAVSNWEVYKTSDAGVVWDSISSNTTMIYSKKIDFTDNQNGYIISNSKLYKTTNGGYSWDSVSTHFLINDFYFKDSLHGWVTTTDLSPIHGLFYTDNGGQSFVQQDTNALTILSFVDDVYGFAAGSKFMTSDQSGLFITVNEVQTVNQLLLSPNPVSNIVSIQSPKLMLRMELFNIHGKMITQKSIRSNSYRFDVSDFIEGVYIFRIFMETETAENKFIVIH